MDKPLMQYLKEETLSKHGEAEGHPFQGALAQGRLSFDSYCTYLLYLHALHQGFEQRLREMASSDQSIQTVVKPEYYQVPFLKSDIEKLKLTVPNGCPSPSIEKFLQLPLLSKEPVSLLGILYVLLGSKHGAKFIAHNVKEAYKLNGGGYSYFDPYGANFRELWQSFIASMNQLPLNQQQRDAALEGARATFDVFGGMGEEIWNAQKV